MLYKLNPMWYETKALHLGKQSNNHITGKQLPLDKACLDVVETGGTIQLYRNCKSLFPCRFSLFEKETTKDV